MLQPDLQGQVVLVTGASRGIGEAIGLALGRCRAHVVLAARCADQLDAVAQRINDAGGTATAIATDLADERQIVRLFDHIREGPGRLDVLINNAGIGIFGPTAQFSTADFDRIMSVNGRGTFLCCREALRLMMPRRTGYIINISSVVGFKGYPNQAAYTASKHAVMGLTKSLAAETQAAGIRVSAILPGGVDTDMAGDARPDLDRTLLLSSDDVAQSVLYLLSLSDRAAVDQIYLRRRTSAPF